MGGLCSASEAAQDGLFATALCSASAAAQDDQLATHLLEATHGSGSPPEWLRVYLERSIPSGQLPNYQLMRWRSVSRELRELVSLCTKSLEIRRCRPCVGTVLLRMPNLETLSLRDSPAVDDEFLTRCVANRSWLTHLDLSFCPRVTRIEGLLAPSRITSLKLSGTAIDDDALISLLGNCNQLMHLDLTHCTQLTDRGFIFATRLCRSLRVLGLANCPQLSSGGLAKLAESGTLTQLNVAGCNLGDSAMEAVLKHNHGLRALNIVGIAVTDRFLKSLCCYEESMPTSASVCDSKAELKFCPRLASLNLSECHGISDEAIVELCRRRMSLQLMGVRTRRIVTRRLTELNMELCLTRALSFSI